MAGVNSKAFLPNYDNLETFSLVWLDVQVNTTEDNRKTQLELRKTINHLKTFDDQQQCHHYILSLSPQDRLVLIISGRCGRQLVPQIHQLRQLSSIYVYCMDKQLNEQWAKNYTKVKSVIVKLDDLIDQIKADQKSRVKIEEPLSMNIFTVNNNPDQSTTGLNGHFLHSLLLIDVLIRMKSIETDKQQLITVCKTEYKNNSTQLAIVREFENEYSADKALWWYTRDSFLYRMLNKALRVQNIDLLFLFRFVISDMYRQLTQNQCQSPVRVYRSQEISDDELSTLRRSIGEFISINSFFSTSASRQRALGFLNSCKISNDLHRVLFMIDADPAIVTSKPFADIRSLSDFGNECEVLFMIGCIFRLIDIRRDNNEKIWVIRMKLCGDDEHDLKGLFDHMKEEYGDGDNKVTLHSFGNVLRRMGKYDLAEKMYHRSLHELPSNDPSLPSLYWSLGIVSKNKRDYDSSAQWFHKSLKIYMQSDPSNYCNIGGLYNWIGETRRLKGDNNTALEYYNKALELFKQAHDENNPDVAHFYNNIANVYSFLQQYDLARQYHEQSLQIDLKSLPSQHPDIAKSYKNIGLIHERKGEWKQALTYYQKAATIRRHSLPAQHPDVIQIEKDIERVSLKLK